LTGCKYEFFCEKKKTILIVAIVVRADINRRCYKGGPVVTYKTLKI